MSFLMPENPSGEAQGCTTSKKKSGRCEDILIDNGQRLQAPTTTKTPKLRKRRSEPKTTATISATPTLAATKPPHKERRGRPPKNLHKTQQVVEAVETKRGRPKKNLNQTQQMIVAVGNETKIPYVLRSQSSGDTRTLIRTHQSVDDMNVESYSGTAEYGTIPTPTK